MNTTRKPGRVAKGIGVTAVVLAALIVLSLIVVTLVVNGVIKFGDTRVPGAGAFLNEGAATCDVSYYALDPNDPTKSNPDKEVPYAMGTPVTERDEAGIKAELEQRRECGSDDKFDPELTASLYADWSASGRTKIEVAYSEIDAFTAEIAADPELYAQVVTELETQEDACAFSIEEVPAGLWSVYVVPDGNGGLTTHVGRSSNPGQAAVFTCSDGTVIKYRLNCGFQILHETPPPGLPECEGNDCNPVCPYNPNLPPDSPDCFAPKGTNPNGYVYPEDKPKVVDDGGGEGTADTVETEVEGENGGTTSSTDDVGAETGTSSEGTTNNTGNNGQEEENQGGTGNGTDTGGF